MTTVPRLSHDDSDTNIESETAQKNTSYLTGVNGLRALGIIAVILYHLRPTSPAPGGFIGVTLFFVISGFLVTRSLLRELDAENEIAIGRYLIRRVSRLWPSMVVVTAFSAIASFVFSPSLLVKMHDDAIPSLAFFSNWFYIFRQVPYFAQAGLPSPLTHLWFVAVIMQFYLLAPVIVLLLRELFRSRLRASIALIVLACASAIEMALLFAPGTDSSRVYYGLDTRLAELLVGMALAYVDFYVVNASPRVRSLLSLSSWFGLAFLVLVSIYARGYMTWLYRGGFFLSALVSALLICGAMLPGAFSRLLSFRPIQLIASRSMSAYIWHYPLILLMNPARRTSALPWWGWVLELAVFLCVVEAAYRFVEKAPSWGSLQTWRALRGGKQESRRVRACASLLVGGLTLSLVTACVPSHVLESGSKKVSSTLSSPTPSASQAEPSAAQTETSTTPTPVQPRFHEKNGKVIEPQAAVIPDNYDPSQWQCSDEEGTCSVPFVLIGDSVAEGASYYWIPAVFPDSFTDTEVGRSFEKGIAVYREDLAQGHDGTPVIVALGGNGPITSVESAAPLIEAAGERPVFFVTVRAPHPFQDENNALMYKLAEKYPQVGILDWYKFSEGHDDYFYDDGQHLTEDGRKAYVRMIEYGLMGQDN